jgi:hypothetical protein
MALSATRGMTAPYPTEASAVGPYAATAICLQENPPAAVTRANLLV